MSTNTPSSLRSALVWLGFLQDPVSGLGGAGHGHEGGHGHTHGVIDPTIATTDRGIWAIKWSFVILAITAAFQIAVVLLSGSVALLADTIHNVGDAVTAVPLWIAFRLARRKPSKRFTYGYGRVEDLAGVAIIAIILFSALVAGYEAIDRLLHPQQVQQLLWVTLAGIAGFIGNEAVAVFRIRVGRQINSAALIADGYHARTDGLTSLAVVLGAAGVWFGFPLADPIIGLLITIAIMGIVWQSSKAVFTRMLDGVEPAVIEEIRRAAEHVPGIQAVLDTKARWIGHRLVAELDIAVDGAVRVDAADAIAKDLERELAAHVPALASTRLRVRSAASLSADAFSSSHGHAHHSPEAMDLDGRLVHGRIAIVQTPNGERMRFTPSAPAQAGAIDLAVHIARPSENQDWEVLPLELLANGQFESRVEPAEPHEFRAELRVRLGGQEEALAFEMHEPPDHLPDAGTGHRH